MFVDLKFDGKYVVVVGGGSESYRKTMDFLDAGAKILVISKSFSSEIKHLQELGKSSCSRQTLRTQKHSLNASNLNLICC